jgi:hypothetical protein
MSASSGAKMIKIRLEMIFLFSNVKFAIYLTKIKVDIFKHTAKKIRKLNEQIKFFYIVFLWFFFLHFKTKIPKKKDIMRGDLILFFLSFR